METSYKLYQVVLNFCLTKQKNGCVGIKGVDSLIQKRKIIVVNLAHIIGRVFCTLKITYVVKLK